MQKRLVKVGNSLGLVIDKSLLSVMNVTRTTRLRMTLEGGRWAKSEAIAAAIAAVPFELPSGVETRLD